MNISTVRKSFNITNPQTVVLWTPATGKKFVVTDFYFTATGNQDGTLTIYDETNTADNWLYKGEIDILNNSPVMFCANLTTPFVASAADNSLKVTVTGPIDIIGTVIGFEAID